MSSLRGICTSLARDYEHRTPTRLKLIDAFLVYTVLCGVLQFVYCVAFGSFPYNAFLSGFISCVGMFVFAGQ